MTGLAKPWPDLAEETGQGCPQFAGEPDAAAAEARGSADGR